MFHPYSIPVGYLLKVVNICLMPNRLSPVDTPFLTEYFSVKPGVKVLNILQTETNIHIGWLLPVIFQLKEKLGRETSSNMILPLIRAIQEGVQKRFGGGWKTLK